MVDNFATLTLINYEGTVYRIYIVMGGSCQQNVYEIDYGILVKLLLLTCIIHSRDSTMERTTELTKAKRSKAK